MRHPPIFAANGARTNEQTTSLVETSLMTAGLPAIPRTRRLLSARRIVLLATAAALSIGLLYNGTPGAPQATLSPFVSSANAQTASRPVGFADIVEKVKPSVISVRVKVAAGAHATGLGEDDLQ